MGIPAEMIPSNSLIISMLLRITPRIKFAGEEKVKA